MGRNRSTRVEGAVESPAGVGTCAKIAGTHSVVCYPVSGTPHESGNPRRVWRRTGQTRTKEVVFDYCVGLRGPTTEGIDSAHDCLLVVQPVVLNLARPGQGRSVRTCRSVCGHRVSHPSICPDTTLVSPRTDYFYLSLQTGRPPETPLRGRPDETWEGSTSSCRVSSGVPGPSGKSTRAPRVSVRRLVFSGLNHRASPPTRTSRPPTTIPLDPEEWSGSPKERV